MDKYCIHNLDNILENYEWNEDELIAYFALQEAKKQRAKKK